MRQKILLVEPETQKSPVLENNLLENGYEVLLCTKKDTGILEAILLLRPDIIVLYEKEPQAKLLDTIRLIQKSTPTPIIIFVDSCKEELISAAITAGASSFVVDSMESHRIRPIIEAGTARFKKCQTMKTRLSETERKLIERRDIDRAKGILMKKKNIDEDEAYKMLRKIAMDKNQQIGKVASSLIQAAELLD